MRREEMRRDELRKKGWAADDWEFTEGPGAGEQALLRHLFMDYDTDARGVTDPNTPVTVTLALLLLRIQALVRCSISF